MSRARTLGRNTLSNWFGFAVRAAVTFLLTPFVLSKLGDERFGVWLIVGSVVGSYGLLDLGMRGGLTQYLTRFVALGDFVRANETFNSALLGLSAVGGVAFGVSLAVGAAAPHLFDIPPNLEDEIFACIVLVGAAAAIQFASFPHAAVFTTKQRFDLTNAVSIGALAARTAWTVVALLMGGGLVAVSVGTLVSGIVEAALRVWFARRLIPELRMAPRQATWAAFSQTMSFGLWNFLISVSSTLGAYSLPLVVGWSMPLEAVTRFGVALRVAVEAQSIVATGLMVFYPMLVELHAQSRTAEIRVVTVDGTRLTYLVLATITIISVVWADDFFRLWVGEAYVSSPDYPSTGRVFQVLSLATVFRFAPGVANQLALAAGAIRPLASSSAAEVVSSITLAALAIPRFGLLGAAWAVLASAFVFRLLIQTPIGARLAGLSVIGFFRAAAIRPIIFSVLLAAACTSMRRIHPALSLVELLASGTIAVAMAAAMGLAFVVKSDERERFVKQPLLRLLEQLRAGRNA